jgi:hypothetical protein
MRKASVLLAVLGGVSGLVSGVENVMSNRYTPLGGLAHILGWTLGMAVFGVITGTAWNTTGSGMSPPRGMALRLFFRMTVGGAIGGAISGAVSAAVNKPDRIMDETLGVALGVAIAGAIGGPLLGWFIDRHRPSQPHHPHA